jgi:hypothetical protein
MKMTKEQFKARVQHIDEQFAALQERSHGYRDQELAKLFVECDWSQDELADELIKLWDKEVSRQWVGQHLRFGRFISFFATSGSEDDPPGAHFKLPHNLTERGFRHLWDATESSGNFSGHKANTQNAVKDEQRRFIEVVELLKQTGLSRKAKPVRKAIIKRIAGKNWLTAQQIVDRIAQDFDSPVSTIDVLNCFGKFTTTVQQPYRLEKSGEGDTAKYRILKVQRVIDKKYLSQWSHEIIPMCDLLIREAKKGPVAVSLTVICDYAARIKKVMESVTAEIPSDDVPSDV